MAEVESNDAASSTFVVCKINESASKVCCGIAPENMEDQPELEDTLSVPLALRKSNHFIETFQWRSRAKLCTSGTNFSGVNCVKWIALTRNY